jgi:6-phospho 3-hexuloisomerase
MNVSYLLKILEKKIENANISTAKLVESIYNAERVFITGVGRSGLIGKLFAMRLMHIEKLVYIVGEVTTPKIKKDDLLIAITGSGTTFTIVSHVKIAKAIGARILVLTAKTSSIVEKYSNEVIVFNMKSKYEKNSKGDNIMPLGSAFELSALVTLEASIADLITRLNIDESFLRERHTNLE